MIIKLELENELFYSPLSKMAREKGLSIVELTKEIVQDSCGIIRPVSPRKTLADAIVKLLDERGIAHLGIKHVSKTNPDVDEAPGIIIGLSYLLPKMECYIGILQRDVTVRFEYNTTAAKKRDIYEKLYKENQKLLKELKILNGEKKWSQVIEYRSNFSEEEKASDLVDRLVALKEVFKL